MINIIKVDDINDERISLYRSLRFTPKSHQENKLFIVEGRRVVTKLLLTSIPIHSIFATEDFLIENYELILNRVIDRGKIFSAEKKTMEKIVGFRLHTGVMALAYVPPDCPLDKMQGIVVATNGVNNAENIGSIVRNLVGFGFENIIVDSASASPYLRRAVRVSMGSIFYVKVKHTASLIEDLKLMKFKGYQIVAIELTENSVCLNEHKFEQNTLLIFGSEDKGVEDNILEHSDKIIKISISDKISSLNVSSCSAIALYEISKSVFSPCIVHQL